MIKHNQLTSLKKTFTLKVTLVQLFIIKYQLILNILFLASLYFIVQGPTIAHCMDNEQTRDIFNKVGDAAARRDFEEVERILRSLEDTPANRIRIQYIRNRMEQRFRELSWVLDTRTGPYGNEGVPPSNSYTFRNAIEAIAIAGVITVGVWLLFRHWDFIRDILFDMGRISFNIFREVTLQNLQLYQHDPSFIRELLVYLQALPEPRGGAGS